MSVPASTVSDANFKLEASVSSLLMVAVYSTPVSLPHSPVTATSTFMERLCAVSDGFALQGIYASTSKWRPVISVVLFLSLCSSTSWRVVQSTFTLLREYACAFPSRSMRYDFGWPWAVPAAL